MSNADPPARTAVLIVGGGAMGASVAHFLKGPLGFPGDVTVLEPDPTYRSCATSLSLGSVRRQFSTPINIRMSAYGAAFFADATRHLSVDGGAVDIGWETGPYLFLASPAGVDVLRGNHAVQRSEGADVTWLDPEALRARFPWISTEGIAGAVLGSAAEEGRVDGYRLLRAMKARAVADGARFVADAATEITREGDRVTGARTASGATVAAEVTVLAAGAASGRLAATAGVPLPIGPRKRTVFSLSCPDAIPDLPLIVDPSGVYVRRDGDGFLSGCPPETDPETDDLTPDWALFDDRIWPALAHRIPAFARLKTTGAWAGAYEMNALDANAVIGPHPDLAGLMFICGFSGHGVQHAPAAGRAVAERIALGRCDGPDPEPLGYGRIAANRPLIERNVI